MQGVRPSIRIHRAPRRWPHIPSEAVTIQSVQSPSRPSNTALFTTGAGIIGLAVAAFVYSGSSGGSSVLILGFLAVSGITMVTSLVTVLVQRHAANSDTRELVGRYTSYLDSLEQSIGALCTEENAARKGNDPTIADMVNTLSRRPERAWQRCPEDPDFLVVRIGTGDAPSQVRVQLADREAPFAPRAKGSSIQQQQMRARHIATNNRVSRDVPLTVALREHGALALINGAPGVVGSSDLARAMVGHVALHHAPNDVQILVFAPKHAEGQWKWFSSLPTTGGEWQGLATQPNDRQQRLSMLLTELSRRKQALGERLDNASFQQQNPPLPHLLIVVDSFADSAESDPLTVPALALALQHGRSLGATVLTVHSALQQAPRQTTLAVDVEHKCVLALGPNPTTNTDCATIDSFDVNQGQGIASVLEHLELEVEASLDVPARVRLLPLLSPPINRPEDYPIEATWKLAYQRRNETGNERSFVIPLGRKIGSEPVNLDFVNDGPHGLLIGQTGSGKSEILRSIIAALAIQYPPDMVNFVLVDYKSGLAFDAFEHLPHTVAYLTNMVQPGQTNRFLAMLDAEIVRRQSARVRKEPQPELFVIIDEFAEMIGRRSAADTTEIVLDNLLSIARLGRELGVHLLFAAQRPEGSIIQRLRGYVQYRICLRTNTAEDSRDVINVPDAAQVPIEFPGRGYLLRGDNELSLLQAARISVPSFQSGMMHVSRNRADVRWESTAGSGPNTVDRIIAERMRHLPDSPAAVRWPAPLPMPTPQTPTPLALFVGSTPAAGTLTWNAGKHAPLRSMEVPLGVYDRPSEQRQEWFVADLVGHDGKMHGGPLLVMGDMNSGKTTTLQTLLFYLATTHGPSDLRWFILNPSGSLAEFAALPQAFDLIEPGTCNVIAGQDSQEFNAFAARFQRAVQREHSTRPSVLLVVDDYDELGTQHTSALHSIAELAIRQRERNVYIAIAATRQSFNGLPQTIINTMATRIGLYMNERDQMRTIINGRLPAVLDAIPGRGLVQTRRSLDDIQIAVPVVGKDDAERLERLEEGVRQLAQRWQ